MLGVFLRNEPRDSREPHQPGLRYGIDQPVGEVGLDPLVLVSPDDERRRLDLSVLVFVQISFVHRARQRQKVLRAILSDERSEVAGDELHRHVLLIGDTALEHSLEEGVLKGSVADQEHMPMKLIARYLAPFVGKDGAKHLLTLASAVNKADLDE